MLGAIVLLLAFGVYAVWSVKATRSDLQAARVNGEQLQTALVTEDTAAMNRSLRALQGHFSDAHDRTDGLLWVFASQLPFLGNDVQAVRVVSEVGDDLSEGTLAELVEESATRLQDRLVPRKGRVDIAAVESIAPLVSRASRNLNEGAGRLRSVDSESLTRWVRPSYEVLEGKVNDTAQALSAANRAVQVLPTMLGKDEPRTYLVLFNNNAEIRATGGLPGAFAVIRTDEGRVSLVRQGAPADIGKFSSPVLAQSPAERQIYDTQIAEYFQDTNFTPEFPRTAGLVREMWKRTQNGEELDGVLSVDTVTLSYLLRATGSISTRDGVRLTSGNATRELLNNAYFRLPDDGQQDQFFSEVALRIFTEVINGVDSPSEFFVALAQGAKEGRLYIYDFNQQVQRVISGSAVSGELTAGDSRKPHVGVYLNDATGSKMSYYLRTEARLRSESCSGNKQQLEAIADFTHVAGRPEGQKLNDFITGPGTYGTPKGEQLVLVRVYGPQGGELSSFRVAGKPVSMKTVDDRGRPVATTVVQLREGETVRVSWRVRSAADQDRAARLSVTPGMTATAAVKEIASKCGAA